MKIRIQGTEKEREKAIMVLMKNFDVYSISQIYECRENEKEKLVYVEILSEDQKIVSNLQDWQVINYCSQWRSKADLMHYFKVKYEEAEEILNRLESTGALNVDLEKCGHGKSHYIYKDARLNQDIPPSLEGIL